MVVKIFVLHYCFWVIFPQYFRNPSSSKKYIFRFFLLSSFVIIYRCLPGDFLPVLGFSRETEPMKIYYKKLASVIIKAEKSSRSAVGKLEIQENWWGKFHSESWHVWEPRRIDFSIWVQRKENTDVPSQVVKQEEFHLSLKIFFFPVPFNWLDKSHPQ